MPFRTRWKLAIALIGFLVTTNNITSFFVPLSVQGFLVYCHLEKFYTAISPAIDLSNKFVDWMCFGYGWCLMDAFRLNCQLSGFIRFRLVHSNNRWHKCHGSIRKVFGCMDHILDWLYFSKNDVFDGFAYVIHYRTSTTTYSRTFFLVIVEK